MAANIEFLDASFPTFTGRESPGQRVQMLTDYIFQSTQSLRFVLENLGTGNWNQADLKKFQEATIQEVNGKIDTINENINDIKKDLGKLQETVTGHTTELTDLQTKVSKVSGTQQSMVKTLKADGEGGGTLGTDGKRLDILGTVYVNGVLWKP